MNRQKIAKTFESIEIHKLKWLMISFCLISFLMGCKPSYPPNTKPVLHTTISADGEMVATLLNAGTEQQLLRIRTLNSNSIWRTVAAPPFTQSIRFASEGHALLVTYRIPESNVDVLARLNLEKPDAEIHKIYEAANLAFPVELSPGQILVRTRRQVAHSVGENRSPGYYWILIGPERHVQQVGPESLLPYPAPNIVGMGFFWTEDQVGKDKEPHPLVLSYPLPNGRAPTYPRERLAKNTWTIECDRAAKRCLREYIRNLDEIPRADYIYDVEVMFGAERCKLAGVSGFHDGISITPDGKAAVMALAPAYDKPRRVVIMRFNPQKCEASSVQLINF